MTDSDTVGPIRVDLGPCQCGAAPDPGSHTADYVLIARHAPYQMGLAALEAVSQATEPIGLGSMLRQIYVKWGVVGWNLIGADGQPLAVNHATIEANLMTDWSTRSIDVAEACALQYNDEVMLPLQERALRRSVSGQTTEPTSLNRASRRERAKPSVPSSPTSSEAGNTYEDQAN